MAERQMAWRQRLAGVGVRPVAGTWHRMVSRSYRDQAHSDEGARLRGGRYNPPGEFGGLYLAESEEACRAELLRHADVLPDLSLATFDVSVSRVLDLTDAEVQRRLGVSDQNLTGDDHSLTREIGEAAFELGFEGILFPSDVLKADDVSPRQREAWVRRRAPQLDALVTSPRLVGEGLDLVEFPTVVWVEPEYSTYIVRQVSRRTWRIGQAEPVHVYFLVYRQTIQAQALALVARGIRAASLVDGEVPPEDSLAGYGEAEFLLELARMVVESTSIRDLDAILQDAAAHAANQQAFLDPRAALEQSSSPLAGSATRDIAATIRTSAQMSSS